MKIALAVFFSYLITRSIGLHQVSALTLVLIPRVDKDSRFRIFAYFFPKCIAHTDTQKRGSSLDINKIEDCHRNE